VSGRRIGALTLAGLAGVAILAATWWLSGDTEPPASTSEPANERTTFTTAVVARTTLVDHTEVAGTLGYGAVEALPNLVSGVVTWVPEAGQIMTFGDVLYEIDGRPVFLFEGSVPMYRNLDSRSSDGDDIRQLEQLLVDLGYGDDLTVDENFSSATRRAIEAWESDVGLPASGNVGIGRFVYRPIGFRVSSVNAMVGQQISGGSILSVSSTERVVSVALDTSLADLLELRRAVDVELADGTVVDGTVTYMGSTAVTEGQGPNATSYIEVEISLAAGGTVVDESPVVISVEQLLEEDAVVVPIPALLALAEGGYAVEILDPDGTVRLVGVDLGTFLDNLVSVVGEVNPGDRVIVP